MVKAYQQNLKTLSWQKCRRCKTVKEFLINKQGQEKITIFFKQGMVEKQSS